jgi:outer membrane receptor protein involved in Fe transport
MTARYKAGKNLNLDLDCYNLTNSQQYVLRSLDGVNQYDDIYLLRPRQILLKVSFSY